MNNGMTLSASKVGAARPNPHPHRYDLRVYIEDTDAASIVYYANYLRFAERARTEMLRSVGLSHAEMIACDGLALAVRRCAVEYMRPARLDDVLTVETVVCGMGAATVDLRQWIRRGGDLLTEMTLTIACINKAGRPERLPVALRQRLAEFTITPNATTTAGRE